MSHSKRNTTRPVFTSYERALAKSDWNSTSARLGRESFLPFGSCSLCLETARDPVSCQYGDVFCRECILANLVAQKKELKRVKRTREKKQEFLARHAATEDHEDQKRSVLEFERTQAGNEAVITTSAPVRPELSAREDSPTAMLALSGDRKRKFELDVNELDRIVKDDKVKARKAIDQEKAAKPTLPSFWTPSLTPELNPDKIVTPPKATNTTPSCPASTGSNPHLLSMQDLTAINFDEQIDSSTNEKRRTCPSCRKWLTNSSAAVMTQKCGHVLCRRCVDQFLIPQCAQQTSGDAPVITCYVCNELIAFGLSTGRQTASALPKGLVALTSGGTGFIAGGKNTVEKSSTGFQC